MDKDEISFSDESSLSIGAVFMVSVMWNEKKEYSLPNEMKNFINLGIFIPLRASLLEFINSADVACADAALQSLPGFAFSSLVWAKT